MLSSFDGIKDDNRIENLEVMEDNKHSHFHNPKGMKPRNPYGRRGKPRNLLTNPYSGETEEMVC